MHARKIGMHLKLSQEWKKLRSNNSYMRKRSSTNSSCGQTWFVRKENDYPSQLISNCSQLTRTNQKKFFPETRYFHGRLQFRAESTSRCRCGHTEPIQCYSKSAKDHETMSELVDLWCRLASGRKFRHLDDLLHACQSLHQVTRMFAVEPLAAKCTCRIGMKNIYASTLLDWLSNLDLSNHLMRPKTFQLDKSEVEGGHQRQRKPNWFSNTDWLW